MNNILNDLFDYLNRNCNYLVLRNWDNLLDEDIYSAGHEDIDILCDSLDKFLKLTGAKRLHPEKDRDNYVVSFSGANVRFDVRWVGDGYYPIEMEKAMLNNRQLNEQSFYIPSIEDYYYSLAYHALLQKPFLSDEYLQKLNNTRQLITNSVGSMPQSAIREELILFLKLNGWKVELPCDPGVYVNTSNLQKFPIKNSPRRKMNRNMLLLKQWFLSYYHRFFGFFI